MTVYCLPESRYSLEALGIIMRACHALPLALKYDTGMINDLLRAVDNMLCL